jgi:ParB family chromosome partitioning protein
MMAKNQDAALLASMSNRRDPVKLARDMEETPFAHLAAQVKDPIAIPITNIYMSPFQSRVESPRDGDEPDEDYLTDLAATIEREGLLNPILVRVLESNTPISPKKRVLESNTPPVDGLRYELIAGENRVKAHIRLGREVVPAKVLRLTDIEAARALTVDNLVRKPMTDWELYLHIGMLRAVGAASTQKELGALLNCSRIKVVQLECFGKLPARAQALLNERPALVGANQVYELSKSGFLESNPAAVAEAVEKVSEGKINQTGMVSFVQRKVKDRDESERREYQLTRGRSKVRVVSKNGETRITGDVDADALREVLQQHLDRLLRREDKPLPDEDGA